MKAKWGNYDIGLRLLLFIVLNFRDGGSEHGHNRRGSFYEVA